jgi:Ca-activated chloride channel family protein
MSASVKVGASVVSYRPEANEDGFFLLLASPEIKAVSALSGQQPKTVQRQSQASAT